MRIYRHLLALLALTLAFAFAPAAHAEVTLTFHSFNGSVIVGRYPHTFVSLAGTLSDGTAIKENYGFSAKSTTEAAFGGDASHIIMTEKDKWLTKTNRHFTVSLDDAEYRAVRAEVARWRDAPGKYYNLNSRNCIHFVGAIAKVAGLKVGYPEGLLKRPKAWLNHVTTLNPHLSAKLIN